MNNDEGNNENLVDKAKEIKEDVETAQKIAANAASGNWIGVAKEALKKLKDKNFIKKKLKASISPICLTKILFDINLLISFL